LGRTIFVSFTKSIGARIISIGLKTSAVISVAITAGIATAQAAYMGAGELRGTVTEVRRQGHVVVFSLKMETQDVSGPRLANPARLLYSGDRIDEIKPGVEIRLFFSSGSDIDCDPCGLFVTRLDLPEGPSVYGETHEKLQVSGYQAWWVEPVRGLTGICWLSIGIIMLFRRLRRFETRRIG
jgi:hypothetical protein